MIMFFKVKSLNNDRIVELEKGNVYIKVGGE